MKIPNDINLGVVAVMEPPAEPDVVLTLPADVARTLYRMTCLVRGLSGKTYRGHVDAIERALRVAGVRNTGIDTRFDGSLDAKPVVGDGE